MKLVKFNEKDFIDEPFEMLALLNIEYGEEERWVTGKIVRNELGGLDIFVYNYCEDSYEWLSAGHTGKVKFYVSLD